MPQYLNTPQTNRRPRWRLLLNGTTMLAETKLSVHHNNNFTSDRFDATIVLSMYDSTNGIDWWSSQDNGITIRVDFGFLTPDQDDNADPQWTTVFDGQVDNYDYDTNNQTYAIAGRDLSARLIDKKILESYPNKTASEIAIMFAQEHGLKPVVTTTTTKVGEYYKSDHVRTTGVNFNKGMTEWALLVMFAKEEGFDLFVEGIELHFEPPKAETDTPYLLDIELDPETGVLTGNSYSDLRLSRDFTLSKDIKVIVHTWSHEHKRAHHVTASTSAATTTSTTGSDTTTTQSSSPGKSGTFTAGGEGGGGSGSKPKGSKGSQSSKATEYVFNKPGLSAAAAQAFANQELAYLTKLERRVSFSMPGSLDFGPRDNLRLVGTSSSHDGLYFVSEMTREFSTSDGYRVNVTAKNHSSKGQIENG